jgi:glucosamine--fructose-6-phosphate aminotransferase (isomerizing)
LLPSPIRETADTLAALQEAKKLLLNILWQSAMWKAHWSGESDLILTTRAGPEIGVASTKAFTTQLATLMLLVIAVGRRFHLTEKLEQKITSELFSLPGQIEKVQPSPGLCTADRMPNRPRDPPSCCKKINLRQ